MEELNSLISAIKSLIDVPDEDFTDEILKTILDNMLENSKKFGKELWKKIKEIFDNFKCEKIIGIKYIWNGTNDYVGKWLEKFDAVNNCPINLMKYSGEDFPESHI